MVKEQELFTKEQMDIALLKNTNEEFHRSFDRIEKHLDKIESNLKWILGIMGTGFLGLLSLMAHGFKWII
jgi:hypothetical protein